MTAAQLSLLLVFSGIGILVTAGAVTCLAFYWGRALTSWLAYRRALRATTRLDALAAPPPHPNSRCHTDPAADQVWVPLERKWPL